MIKNSEAITYIYLNLANYSFNRKDLKSLNITEFVDK